MPLAGFLLSLVGPLVARILAFLGMSFVTIVGVEATIFQLKVSLLNSKYSLGADLINLFALAGGDVCIAIVFGAINTRIAIWAITKASSLLVTSS
jgi:Protein of unknown function (DUF2523)